MLHPHFPDREVEANGKEKRHTQALSSLRTDLFGEPCPLLVTVLASVAGAVRPDPGLHPTHHFVPAPCRVGSTIITELYTRSGEACDPVVEKLSWVRSEMGGQVSDPVHLLTAMEKSLEKKMHHERTSWIYQSLWQNTWQEQPVCLMVSGRDQPTQGGWG